MNLVLTPAAVLLASFLLTGCSSTSQREVERVPASEKAELRWIPAECTTKQRDPEKLKACQLAHQQRLAVLGNYLRFIRLRYGNEILNAQQIEVKELNWENFWNPDAKNSVWKSIYRLGVGSLSAGLTQFAAVLFWDSMTSQPRTSTFFSLFGGGGWVTKTYGGGMLNGSNSVQNLDQWSYNLGQAEVGKGSWTLKDISGTEATLSLYAGMSLAVAYFSYGEGYSDEANVELRSKTEERVKDLAKAIASGLGLENSRVPGFQSAIANDVLKELRKHILDSASKRHKAVSDLEKLELQNALLSFHYKTNLIELLRSQNLLNELEYRSYLAVSGAMRAETYTPTNAPDPKIAEIYLDKLEEEIDAISDRSPEAVKLKEDVLKLSRLLKL